MSSGITEIALVLEDGSVFEGESIGHAPENGIAAGEVVFNTTMTGYQEVISDPSYAGQIITFTTAHIGNYGATSVDAESRGTFARGVIVRDMARRHSNWRSEQSLDAMLKQANLPGIGGLDTRRLTRLLRDSGSLRGAFGTADEKSLLAAAQSERGTSGVNLVAEVTTPSLYTYGSGKFSVVAYDFGIKTTILRCLSEIATVTVVPAHTSAEEVLAPSSKLARQRSVFAWATSCSRVHLVDTHSNFRSDITAVTTPCATSLPARLKSQVRTTTSVLIPIRSRELPTSHISISTTTPTRECACAIFRPTACNTTPRRALVHTTVVTYSPNSQK